MKLVFLPLLSVFLLEQLLAEPIPLYPAVQTNQGSDGAKHISPIGNGVDDHDDDDDDDGYDDYDIDYDDDDDDDDEEDKLHLDANKQSRRLNSQLLRGYYDRRNRDHPNYRHERCRKQKYGNGYRVSCRRIRRPVRRQ
ncbi:unnamed protein product [Schistosoma haematobium]|nr:unnamed protein product [Schistosoma haematobium]